ncbi:MAG TPA: hypothetical protein VG937_23040 [Polyangiaceae bacterium]|nr:hypothetical protein [Polyangiaceae bacterium]
MSRASLSRGPPMHGSMLARYASTISLSFCLLSWGFASTARAQSAAQLSDAKAQFDEGRKLIAEGNIDEACSRFEASLSLVDGLGTRFNLADCEERRRHFARAHSLFLQVAEQAKDAGQSEREQVARGRAAALDARLSRLTVELQVPSVEFELDGKPVNNEALSEPVLVEPGTHKVSARRPGKQPWSSQINVPRGGLYVIVKVPPLAELGAASASSEPPLVTTRDLKTNSEASAPDRSNQAERARSARNVALVLGGVGVGALIAGSTFGLQYLASNSDAKDICPSSRDCTQEDVSQHERFLDDTRNKRTWAYVGLGVGAVALSSAAIVYFTLGRQTSLGASTGLNSDGSLNLALHGKF